jgi:hypothetical protein
LNSVYSPDLSDKVQRRRVGGSETGDMEG